MLNFFRGNTPERRVERLIAKGERLFQHGREQEGLEKFAEAATMLPEDAKPSLYLGRAYLKLKDYATALKHYYKALYFCKAAEEPTILGEIAQIYLTLKRYDLVEEKLKKILQLDLPLPLAHSEKIKQAVLKGLTHLYLRTGRISEAIAQQKLFLEQNPADLPGLRLLAEAHRYLGENQAARILLEQAGELAKQSGQPHELADIADKLREVSFPDGAEFGIKERLYAEYGSICLGTAGDNGLELALRPALARLSWQEVTVTLKRLEAFMGAFAWTLTCVVAADKHSELLAALTAHLLDLPLKPVAKVDGRDAVCVCQLVFQDARPMKNVLKKLLRRAETNVTFALVTPVNAQPTEYLPDIIGIPVARLAKNSRKSLQTAFAQTCQEVTGAETAEPVPSEKLIPRLADALRDFPEEEHLTAQIAYYLTHNMQLRVHLIPLLESSRASTEPLSPPSPEKIVNQLCAGRKQELLAALRMLSTQDCQNAVILTTLQMLYTAQRDAGIRRLIGKVLIQKGGAEGRQYLSNLFHTPELDGPFKAALLETLCLSAHRQISNVLCAALQDPQADIRSKAAQHFGRLAYTEVSADLIARLLNDEPSIIVKTMAYVSQCETLPAYGVLQEHLPGLLQHADRTVIAAALDIVREHADSRLTPLVSALLTHPEPDVSVQAIRTLGVIGDRASGDRLLPFLEHPQAAVRYTAAASLTKLDPRRAGVFLNERLPQETPEVQAQFLKLLGEIGSPEAISGIIQFAEQHFDQPPIVAAAVKILAHIQDPRGLPLARMAIAQFPRAEIFTPYITLARNSGTEEDWEALLALLEDPPAIQFRAAAALYQHGWKRYFHILQDGMRSQKIPINLLALEMLGAIGDELSVQTLFTGFSRHALRLDQQIAALICQSGKSIDYYTFFRNLPSAEAEMVLQGIQRAISGSEQLSDVLNALDSLCILRQFDAIPVVQQLCATAGSSVVLCGALKCLARYDPAGSRELIKRRVSDENIEVANTAYVLLSQLKTYGFADE